jgi:hypothetical protein
MLTELTKPQGRVRKPVGHMSNMRADQCFEIFTGAAMEMIRLEILSAIRKCQLDGKGSLSGPGRTK